MKLSKPIKLALRRPPKLRPRTGKSALHSRAAAATMDEPYDEEDYDMEAEPNMKLSHAFIVVLILHLIAVGGVFAFNSIKARQNAETKAAVAKAQTAEKAAESTAVAESAPASAAAPDAWKGKVHTVAAGDTLTRVAALHGTTVEAIEKENGITSLSMIRVGQVLKIPAATASVAPKPATAGPKATATQKEFLAAKNSAAVPAKPATPAKPAAAETQPAAPEVYVVAKGDNPYIIAKKFHVSYSALIAANEIKDPTKIQIGQKLKIPKN